MNCSPWSDYFLSVYVCFSPTGLRAPSAVVTPAPATMPADAQEMCVWMNESMMGSLFHHLNPRWFLFWGYRTDISHTQTQQRLFRVLCWYFLYLILLLLVCQTYFGSSCVEEMMNTVLGAGELWAAPGWRNRIWKADLRDLSLCFPSVKFSFPLRKAVAMMDLVHMRKRSPHLLIVDLWSGTAWGTYIH